MTEPMIRGHVVAHTVRFVRAHLDASAGWRFGDQLSEELKRALDDIVPARWYPRSHQVELMRALAEVRGGPEAAYSDLLLCGSALAAVDNPFMALLMRVMTPELFVRKAPLFWQRDHQGSGALALHADAGSPNRCRLELRDVAGYDHGAVLWLGWMKHILSTLCAGRAEVVQSGWSASDPGPNTIAFDVSWS